MSTYFNLKGNILTGKKKKKSYKLFLLKSELGKNTYYNYYT